jgi:uncharacterized protein (DUF1778 family)
MNLVQLLELTRISMIILNTLHTVKIIELLSAPPVTQKQFTVLITTYSPFVRNKM